MVFLLSEQTITEEHETTLDSAVKVNTQVFIFASLFYTRAWQISP
jgi:hypothetical protein